MDVTNTMKKNYFIIELSNGYYILFAEAAMLISAIASFVIMDMVNFYEVTWEWERIIINALPFYVLGKIIYLISKKLKIYAIK